MRRCESSAEWAAFSVSAAWLKRKLSSRIAPRMERSASTLAGRPRSRLWSVVAIPREVPRLMVVTGGKARKHFLSGKLSETVEKTRSKPEDNGSKECCGKAVENEGRPAPAAQAASFANACPVQCACGPP